MISIKTIIPILAISAIVVPAFADIPESSVPVAVREGIKAGYSQVRKVEWDFSNRTNLYEAEFRINGYTFEVKLNTEGKIVRIKEEIETTLLPEVVRTAILKEYPQSRVKEAKKITQDATITYDVEVLTDTEDYDLLISADGKILHTER